MAGTVPKMAYPQPPGAGAPIYRRLAVITPETGGTPMSVRYGILATLEAKPGRGDDLAAFLTKGRELAVAEAGTVTWYAFKLSDTTYGIFDTFDDEAGRQAHLNGEIPAALGTVADDLLAAAPDIRTIDIVAVK
jgi:quinol monooxygenase YgiN